MESIVLILIIMILSYFISSYIIKQYCNNNMMILEFVITVIVFFTLSYVATTLQKSGTNKAIFIESIFWMTMLPLLPFILLYRYIFDK